MLLATASLALRRKSEQYRKEVPWSFSFRESQRGVTMRGGIGREFITTISPPPIKQAFFMSMLPAFIDQELNKIA